MDDFFDEYSNKHVNSSPKKKHKTKANGFLLFMLEFRRKEAAKGNEMDMNEVQIEAGVIWNQMSSFEREKYGRSSTTSNQPRNSQKQYTSFGLSFDELDRKKKEDEAKHRKMELTIEEMLQVALEQNQLKSLNFYFFSTSYYVQTLNSDIFPAEIALSKFNLVEGVYDTIHMFVNPGELPIGFAADAINHSAQTHKRKLPPDVEGETDYVIIFKKMMEFLGVDDPKKKLPILFVEPGMNNKDYKAAQLTLDKLVKLNKLNIEFRLYPTEYLLFKLHKKTTDEPFSSVLMAKEMMRRDKFEYSDIGCEFHRNEEASQHCCLAKVKRWGFIFSSYCLNDSDEKICGRHYPETESVLEYDDQSDVDSAWNSQLTEPFSRIRIQTASTRGSHLESQASFLSSAVPYATSLLTTPMNSKTSIFSREGSAMAIHGADALQTVDSSLSLSEKIANAKTLKGLRGGKRH